jgi:hypothetical protein
LSGDVIEQARARVDLVDHRSDQRRSLSLSFVVRVFREKRRKKKNLTSCATNKSPKQQHLKIL